MERLWEGYRRFRRGRYAREAQRFRELATGQAPKVMIIACADSRAAPSTIFSAAPGELFVVRNVANLVPPYAETDGHHGTSAAIEFAVTGLKVEHIVVMGHANCGGIAACLAHGEAESVGRFIGPWVSIANEAREEVLTALSDAMPQERQAALERVAIQHSLLALEGFPFVREAVARGRLKLHGAWFSIADGALHWLDRDSGAFFPVSHTSGKKRR